MPEADSAEARATLARRLKRQADWSIGVTPLYAHLLRESVADLDLGQSAVFGVLSGFEHEPGTDALALRFMGSVHRLVLTGRLPDLAAHYPSTGGDDDAEAAWPLFRQALIDHRDELHELTKRRCQTNEVGRSAALLGGFLQIAQQTALPLRLMELGSSAGLNLRWDHYRYEADGGGWGDPSSPLRMTRSFKVPPPFDRTAVVIERLGCDINPIDVTTEEGALTLRSFLWADQVDRFRMLEGAIEVARRVPAMVERIDAAHFLERELASPRPGAVSVVFHSVMWQYLDEATQKQVTRLIESAGARATREAPVAWLRLEPGESGFEVRLRLWPEGSDERLRASSGPHGTDVSWLG